MGLHKSKVIKKIKMDMQSQALKKAPITQLKVSIKKTEKKSDALKSTNSQFRKHQFITEKKVQLDQSKIQSIIDSLNKYYYSNNDGDRKIYLIAELQKIPELIETPIIQIPLKEAIHSKIGFVVHGDILEEFQKKYPQYNVMSQNLYLAGKSFPNLDLILIDYTLYNKIIDKKPSKKIFPFHPSKVPFDYKKHYNIQEYSEYIQHLIGSTFSVMRNQAKQIIPIGKVGQSGTIDNVLKGAIDFIAKLLTQCKGNSIEHLYLKTNKSIELLIY
ncbi:unnamed protein product [Paramecium sonneborni]|uniref:Uncharacterized protein n=1 Tax=Paramecium sonneborni TaxID=65129 RepID=A0A8S1RCN0_9CILI|nr:unnamed protein product [Paramecium sonneborni]